MNKIVIVFLSCLFLTTYQEIILEPQISEEADEYDNVTLSIEHMNHTISFDQESPDNGTFIDEVDYDQPNGTDVGPEREEQVTKFIVDRSISTEQLQEPIYNILDVCFVLDTTGSMSSEIAQVKGIIENIIFDLQQKVIVTNLQLRFAVVAYRDHPPQDKTYVTKSNNFTNDVNTIKFVRQLQALGGGDRSEAVHNGLYEAATELDWKDIPDSEELRYIFHIADAAPHGSQFLNKEEQEGCLCGITTAQVTSAINQKNIKYRLLKVRPYDRLNKMEEIFGEQIFDFDSETIIAKRTPVPRTFEKPFVYASAKPSLLTVDDGAEKGGALTLESLEDPQASYYFSTTTRSEAAAVAPPPTDADEGDSPSLKKIISGYILDDLVVKKP